MVSLYLPLLASLPGLSGPPGEGEGVGGIVGTLSSRYEWLKNLPRVPFAMQSSSFPKKIAESSRKLVGGWVLSPSPAAMRLKRDEVVAARLLSLPLFPLRYSSSRAYLGRKRW